MLKKNLIWVVPIMLPVHRNQTKTTNDALFNIGIRRPSSNQLTLLACLSALPVYMVVGLGFLTYYYQTRETSTRQSSIGEGGGDDAR